MKSPICDMLGIEFPLLAFSHCRDVVAAVSKAGGMGVLGAAFVDPDQLRQELNWIEQNVNGKPYGLDLIVPNRIAPEAHNTGEVDLQQVIPQQYRDFVVDLLGQHDIEANEAVRTYPKRKGVAGNMRADAAAEVLEVAFEYPIRLVANALGVPPKVMLDMGKARGVPVAALVGTKEHALAQMAAGVDILVVSGGEAGGHCGEVSTMVLVPEVCRAVAQTGQNTPVLAAGGIVTGAQMAAAMAMGAAGAWCGSVWLTTPEAETSTAVKQKMLAATSRDTVRSRSRTGKHSRQLRSPWTDAWESEAAPEPMPMPLQSTVSEHALRQIDKLAESGHEGARQLATYWVGQGVGLMNREMSAGQVVQEFKQDFLDACDRLNQTLAD